MITKKCDKNKKTKSIKKKTVKAKPRQKQKQKQTISININSNNKKTVKPKPHNTNNQNPRINYNLPQPIPQYPNLVYEEKILNKLKSNENYVNPNRIISQPVILNDNSNNVKEIQTDTETDNIFIPQRNAFDEYAPIETKSDNAFDDYSPRNIQTQTDPITYVSRLKKINKNK